MKKFALLFALSGFALTSLIAEDSAQVSLPQAAPAPAAGVTAATPNASANSTPGQSARRKGKKHRKHHHRKKAESAPTP